MGWGVAAAGAQAGASILGGIGARKQAGAQAAQAAAQQRAAEVRALEVEATRRDDLVRTLSSFRAARGANGLSLTSPTAEAYANDLRSYARRDYLNEAKAIRMQAQAYGQTAQALRNQGGMSLLTGFLNAGPALGTFGQEIGWIKKNG